MLSDKIINVEKIAQCDINTLNDIYLEKSEFITTAIECRNGLPDTFVYEMEESNA